ncbi:MAG TPA: TonB-dependent receptor [Chitinophagales bacterium]|nr:TonB-dependent receptor [Chitinophagales bacterium]
MYRLLIIIALLYPFIGNAQVYSDTTSNDRLPSYDLEEVIVIAPTKTVSDKTEKPLSSIDEYLSKNSSINMVRKGGYAWEPYINGMATERSAITIDGMQIYSACTDKMDPVTSYVEIANLSTININSGHASATGGSTIAGTMDLKKKKSSFGTKELSGTTYLGLETNNLQKILGTSLSFSHPKLFMDIDFTFRDANNYKAGGRKEVNYSQFTKYNVSSIIGYKINKDQHIEASLIYDHAVDVGYPALPMDVSSAKAFIGSMEHFYHPCHGQLKSIQSKIYYNNITHIMDDSKRPDVPIRMDMPGWSKTGGFYTIISGASKKNSWKTTLSGHQNNSLAEMTMYSNDANQKDMFMLTWPDVNTRYLDAFGENVIQLSEKAKLTFNGGLAVHHNKIISDFGLNSIRIFYPEVESTKTRFLKRFYTAFNIHKDHQLFYTAHLSYGERAPSVSEAYGFYLFNSMDKYDYVGNPNMKNEKSLSASTSIQLIKNRYSFKVSGSYFFINDYIIGQIIDNLSSMTIGASGVKQYEQIKNAHIANVTLDTKFEIIDNLYWNTMLSYRRGRSNDIGDLPLIQPFSFYSELSYNFKSFNAVVSTNGATKLSNYNANFGETAVPAYALINLSLSQSFKFKEKSLALKAGVENLLDKEYTTFSDWNRIPRMGRNFFFNLVWRY